MFPVEIGKGFSKHHHPSFLQKKARYLCRSNKVAGKGWNNTADSLRNDDKRHGLETTIPRAAAPTDPVD